MRAGPRATRTGTSDCFGRMSWKNWIEESWSALQQAHRQTRFTQNFPSLISLFMKYLRPHTYLFSVFCCATSICFSGARKNILLTQILICVGNISNRLFARKHSGCMWLASSKSRSCASYIARKIGIIFKSLQIPVRAWRSKSADSFLYFLWLASAGSFRISF